MWSRSPWPLWRRSCYRPDSLCQHLSRNKPNCVACRLPTGIGGQVRNVSVLPEIGGTLPDMRSIELSIRGMTCAACAARVEKKLNLIGPEVVAAVSFATEKATITAPE